MHGATWTQTGQSQKISLGEQVVHIKPSLDQSAFYYSQEQNSSYVSS